MEAMTALGSDEGARARSGFASSAVTTGAAWMKRASQQWEAKRCWTRWRKLHAC